MTYVFAGLCRITAPASASRPLVRRLAACPPARDCQPIRLSIDVATSPVGNEPLFERRQFANSYDELSPDAAELARAIDGYKVQHRRRFVTFEEMLAVIKSLGYSK